MIVAPLKESGQDLCVLTNSEITSRSAQPKFGILKLSETKAPCAPCATSPETMTTFELAPDDGKRTGCPRESGPGDPILVLFFTYFVKI